MGQRLASVMTDIIEEQLGDEGEEPSARDLTERLASAAGIEPGTVLQILAADIACPPLDRLRGFAEALDVPLQRLRSAAEQDGCEYNDNN